MAETSWLVRTKGLQTALLTFVAALASMLLVFRILGSTSEPIYIWPLTGIQLGFLLGGWKLRKMRAIGQLAGALGVFAGGRIMGLPPWFALSVACTSAIDVWIAGAILSRGVRAFEDLKRRETLLLFVTALIVAPTVVGVAGGLLRAYFLQMPLVKTVLLHILSDSLGIALVLPAMLFLLTGANRDLHKISRYVGVGIPGALLFAVMTGAVFWQSDKPLLFMVFPGMVLILLAAGLEGAVYVTNALAVIACYATAHGHGPFWISHTASHVDRVLLLQVFLWMSAATALPFGALLNERKKADKDAADARLVYRTLLKFADDMITLSSIDGEPHYVSAACERLTGYTPEEFMAMGQLSTFHPDDRQVAALVVQSMITGKREHTFRYRIVQKQGGWRWVEASARAYCDETTGDLGGYVGTIRDISAMKETEALRLHALDDSGRNDQEIVRLTRTDLLTGLPNRRAVDEAIRDQTLAARISGGKISVMMVDVDYFKLFNKEYGQEAGDACLGKIATALRSNVVRANDLVARWSGQEFIVLLPGADIDGARKLAANMLQAIHLLGIEHTGSPHGLVTVSIGIAVSNARSLGDPALLIQQADRAMYTSKQAGKNCVSVCQSLAYLDDDVIPAPVLAKA
jgi:diguanylate cyclase (GGDEF)-like protein/PAS domain S-box-containing protein